MFYYLGSIKESKNSIIILPSDIRVLLSKLANKRLDGFVGFIHCWC